MGDGNARRAAVAREAAHSLKERKDELARTHALVGFDGFIDSIIDVVDVRTGAAMHEYRRLATIEQFAGRCAAFAGKSANIELVVKEDRFGGNGPLMAGAMARLGAAVTYIGGVGREDDWTKLHPTFESFAARCREVVPIAPPAHTDALEFDDGKLMFGKTHHTLDVCWEKIVERVGLEALRGHFARARIVGMCNWTLCTGVQGLWEGLIREVLPVVKREGQGPRRIVIDLSDPAKRSDEDLRRALATLREMDAIVPVTLGLNLAESERVAHVLGLSVYERPGTRRLADEVREAAESIRAGIEIDCVVVHPREGAAGANRAGESDWFDGPFTAKPKLSTGAGDHFTGGFAIGQAAGLGLSACLACACATSGVYVRDAESPTLERLCGLLEGIAQGEA
ncbi:MAG: carbohydrate kinase family protein [Phycisphaerales bacterium]|jgi:sugar/nucleoside kinase (ribokinase family)|nr:carbohydrate kinase family protein [Phycisphaerales bacterium]